MKYAIILPDGAADEPLEALGGKTVLEAANIPAMDSIAIRGRQGFVRSVPEGFLPGSDVATMSILGFDPHTYHTGRAPLEAAAQNLNVGPNDFVFRCNLVTVSEGKMLDFTAGHIRQAEAAQLIADLNTLFEDEPIEFYEGVQYRHLMILREGDDVVCDCVPPHDIPDQPVAEHQPKGPGSASVIEISRRAAELLEKHEVNAVRRDLGENPATNIWLWGQGGMPELPRFGGERNLKCASIAAVDLIRGITRLAGFTSIEVPGATGYLDTDYAAKGRAAVAALADNDVVLVHIEAPDEAGHLGDHAAKIEALERIDVEIVAPVLERLAAEPEWKVLVAPDHPTPCGKRTHTATPPPFCVAGTGVQPVLGEPFCEARAAESGLFIEPGHELMEFFLRG